MSFCCGGICRILQLAPLFSAGMLVVTSVDSVLLFFVQERNLLLRNVNLASLDVIRDILGAAAIDLAADGESSTEDLKDNTLERLGHGAVLHLAGNLNNFIEGDGLGVLDVLLLLAVTRRLLEGLDDQGRGGGNNRDRSLTVLDGELDSHTETLPVTSVLGNVFTDLLGGQTQRTNLGSERRLGADLTTGHTQVDDLHLIGIELGSYRKR
jgi:hypothetical protein